ncbi:NlpC/P60 family protein [Streptomyces sp. NPDC000927]|uniref:C40 family peptidase n=1 Tax=Streptomyces sp. NPDC000927 TaxID=3154371 RepID=UPI0033170958
MPEPAHVELTRPAPEPSHAEPKRPAQKPAQPAKAAASKRAEVRKVVLRSGDTLYALAGRHGTTVKALQRLNALGASTLIYAGDTFRIPSGTGPVEETRKDRPTDGAPSPSAAKPAAKPKLMAKSPARSAPRRVVAFAQAQLGKPYIWGGTGPRGYDCSGLVTQAWKAAGVRLPRTTWGLVRAGTATTRARLVPGDLVIANGGGHVQLYIGHGKVIHAPRPGSTVTIARLAAASDVVSYRHITP